MKNISIKTIKARNYKSFKDIEINLSDFNVIIGPNSAGKSNFLSILQFFRDIINSGVENAISLQGGLEYMLNPDSNIMEIEIVFNYKTVLNFTSSKKFYIQSALYKIQLEFLKNSRKLKKYKYTETLELELKDNSKVLMHNNNGKIVIDNKYLNDVFGKFIKVVTRDGLSDKSILFLIPVMPFFDRGNIPQVYDIDPKLSKRSIPISGLAELEPDGRNIALVLKNLTKNSKSLKKLISLVNVCIPFINKIDTESLADKSILLNIKENFNNKLKLPATFISDGTIEIITLIDILFFERRNFVAIEEPEKNLHPALLQKLIELMKGASKNKQLIITTHSPEIINYVDIKNIFIIKRDKDGFSIIKKAENDKELKYFLNENISISQLFSDGILN